MILSDAATIDHYTNAGVWGRATLDAIFRKSAQADPDRIAVADPPNRSSVTHGTPKQLTYAQADAVVSRLAKQFMDLGLVPGDIVATQLPNTVEQVIVLLACARSGLVASPLPLMWREYELSTALPTLSPKALVSCVNIVGRDHADMMRHAAADLFSVRFVLSFGRDVPDGVIPLDGIFDGDGETDTTEWPDVSANNVLTICWAGGQHPSPCPVPRSHNQWIAAGLMSLLEARIGRGNQLLCPYPLAGLVSIGGFFVPWLLSSGTLHLHHPFELDVFVDQLQSLNIDFTGLPPSVIDALKSDGIFNKGAPASRISSLGCFWPSPFLPENANERAANLSVPVVDIRTFGEMAYVARRRTQNERPCLLTHGEWNAPVGTPSGPVLLTTRVRGGAVSNGNDASLLAGDLMIKSAMMFDAFYPSVVPGSDEPTLEKDSHGFVSTGIRCRFVGATKPSLDCVRREGGVIYHGGMSISACELDRLYAGHDQLSDAAAFSFDDPVMGERIIAAIVPSPGKSITFEDFADYLKQQKVAAYKVPDRVITVKMIPRDEHGEVMRDRVLDQI